MHALTILARVLKEPRFEKLAGAWVPVRVLERTFLEEHGEALRKIVDDWTYDSSNSNEAERKIEELVWATVLIYGVGGWQKDKDFNADFVQ